MNHKEYIHPTYLTARKACTQSSQNHRKGGASILPPITITISSVNLISGSKPKLPPGDDSNMKPKSENTFIQFLIKYNVY